MLVQHSIDYWLWADLIAPESERLLKNVVRVNRQEEADLFYIPFFTTISFFLMEKQQCKALYRVWVHFLSLCYCCTYTFYIGLYYVEDLLSVVPALECYNIWPNWTLLKFHFSQFECCLWKSGLLSICWYV